MDRILPLLILLPPYPHAKKSLRRHFKVIVHLIQRILDAYKQQLTDLNLRDRHIQEIRLKQKLRETDHQNVLFGDLTVEHIVRQRLLLKLIQLILLGQLLKREA